MHILITGAWNQAKDYIKEIEKLGHQVMFLQFEKDVLPCSYEWVEGIIGNGIFLSHPIEKFVNLKYIQLTSAGFDRVPMEYVKEHEIEIYNARGVYSVPMAEFALAGVLNLYKEMDFFRENQKQHAWNKHRGLVELFGKTVCIVGCGSVGTECAKRFQAFGCNLIGVDIVLRDDQCYNNMVEITNLNEILPDVDVLILTLPLTETTRHLLNEQRLNLLKNEAVVVNIARGAIVDTEALMKHVDRLGGVVLDVFEEEPLHREHPLWEKERVIVTPHNSFVGDNNQRRLAEVIMGNLKYCGIS